MLRPIRRSGYSMAMALAGPYGLGIKDFWGPIGHRPLDFYAFDHWATEPVGQLVLWQTKQVFVGLGVRVGRDGSTIVSEAKVQQSPGPTEEWLVAVCGRGTVLPPNVPGRCFWVPRVHGWMYQITFISFFDSTHTPTHWLQSTAETVSYEFLSYCSLPLPERAKANWLSKDYFKGYSVK